MAKRFLTPINVLNAASDPGSASEGDLYYNTAVDKLKVYANSSWSEIGGGGVTSLTGTTNEVEVSASTGSVTISLPATINANTTGSAATLTTSRTIALTGDVTGSASFNGGANASISSTLANTAVTPTSYGSASAVATFTVDSKGRLTAASNTNIAIAQSAVTNLTTDLAAKAPLASPTFTGTVVLPSTTSIGNVSNTEISYLDGVTSAIQTQLNAKANLASPALSGTPTAPTAAVGTNTTQIATTAFVNAEISNDAILKSGGTMTGTLILPASTTTVSSIRIPHGTAPTAPTNGDIWTTTAGLFARINGATVGPFGAGGGVSISDSAPSSPTNGQLWYNSSNGKTYIYYQDGTSNQWVEVGTASLDPIGNYDGGTSTSVYGGVGGIDGGGAT